MLIAAKHILWLAGTLNNYLSPLPISNRCTLDFRHVVSKDVLPAFYLAVTTYPVRHDSGFWPQPNDYASTSVASSELWIVNGCQYNSPPHRFGCMLWHP